MQKEAYSKASGKNNMAVPPVNDFQVKLMASFYVKTKYKLNAKFYEILCINSRIELLTNIFLHIHAHKDIFQK